MRFQGAGSVPNRKHLAPKTVSLGGKAARLEALRGRVNSARVVTDSKGLMKQSHLIETQSNCLNLWSIPRDGIVKLREISTISRRARPTSGPQINKLAVALDSETANKFPKLTIPARTKLYLGI
jgi:hypothetical protein